MLPLTTHAQDVPSAGDEADALVLLLRARQDATIATQFPTTNFGSAPDLLVGRQGSGEFFFSTYALLQWDLSAIPAGSVIERADLEVYQTGAGAGEVLIFELFSKWDSADVTWNTRPGSELYDRTWRPEAAVNQYVSHDITQLVNAWVNQAGQTPNFGLMLGPSATETHTFGALENAANRPPRLRIRYTLPPVRICRNVADPCQPAGGAQVFNKTTGRTLVADAAGLVSGGAVNPDAVRLGNQLWGRLAVRDPYPQAALYHTTAGLVQVNASSFANFSDSDGPEMRFVVRADKPLLLYDLNLSSQTYLGDNPDDARLLRDNVIKASNYLYKFTEGQFALGTVTVRQMYEGWDGSHIKYHTSNVLHPNAAIGGIVLTDTFDISPTVAITYSRGSIFMGSYWNRFGKPPGEPVSYKGQPLTEADMADDWSIALAHELGHYLLFLFDTYTDANGVSQEFIAEKCVGSAMGNAYVPANQAFVFSELLWEANCGETEAYARLQGRTEWQTIKSWYGWAVPPVSAVTGPVPPVPLTRVVFVAPATLPSPLASQLYTLTYQFDQTSSGEARAFLFRDLGGDTYIYEQGKPAKGTTIVNLTDARVDDRLCVYDLNDHAEEIDIPRQQFGCTPVVAGDSDLTMTYNGQWDPFITIEQTGEQQLTVSVQQPLSNGLILQARLIPETDAALPAQSLARNGDTWTAVFNLPGVVEPVYLQLWVDEQPSGAEATRREVVADRGTGGNGAYGPARLHTGVFAMSSDGNATYQGDEPIDLQPGQSIAWQSMPGTPPVPPWKRISGQSYRLDAFPAGLVDQGTISIKFDDSFGVMSAAQNTAPAAAGADSTVRIHFWDGESWQPIQTTVGTPSEAADGTLLATAPSQGVGVYAVMVDSKPALFMPILRR
jgi:hypothetical protein